MYYWLKSLFFFWLFFQFLNIFWLLQITLIRNWRTMTCDATRQELRSHYPFWYHHPSTVLLQGKHIFCYILKSMLFYTKQLSRVHGLKRQRCGLVLDWDLSSGGAKPVHSKFKMPRTLFKEISHRFLKWQ